MQEIDEYLQEKDQLDKRKKEMLFKKWRERVFEPIHVVEISSALSFSTTIWLSLA